MGGSPWRGLSIWDLAPGFLEREKKTPGL